MFEDSRVLAPALFASITGMDEATMTGDRVLASLSAADRS